MEKLIDYLTPIIESQGYELVHLEVQTHRSRVLRVFIDHLASNEEAIGVEDCVKVSRALDEPLEAYEEIAKMFPSGYELEVSSPGVDRPLRKHTDYEKFAGREARIHVFRPLTADELSNPDYQGRNPKQKHFVGTLKGLRKASGSEPGSERIVLAVPASMGAVKKPLKPGQKPKGSERMDEVTIPLPLISKANLEPGFEIKRESAG